MTTQHSVWWLFLGFGIILVLASSVGLLLRMKYGKNNSTIVNLNARINAWWVMIFVLILSFSLGRVAAIILFFLISLAALWECLKLLNCKQNDYLIYLLCFGVILPVQYYFIFIDWYGMFSIFIPVYCFLVLPILATLSGNTENFLTRTAKTQWAVMTSIFAISHVPALLNLNIPGFTYNIALIIFLIAVVQASDVLQYIWGKLLGRRKIAPTISPSKTVIGFAGGVGSATLLAAGLYWITPFTPLEAAAIGLLICLMGFAGGLVMSAIKRDLKVKDWGNMIQGHGGMMDRMDSICFSAPIFFHVVRYFWS